MFFQVIGYPYHNGDNQHWTFDWTGNSWTIRSVSTGQYLGVESTNYSDGDKLVTVSSPFNWDIWHDEANPNAFRWVFFCAFPTRLVCSLMGVYQNSLIFWHVSKLVSWAIFIRCYFPFFTSQYCNFGWTFTDSTRSSVSLFTIPSIILISTIGEPQLRESLLLCGGPGKAFIRPGRLSFVSSNK